MDNMSPQQQQQDSLSRGGGQQINKRRLKSQSYRRQSAPSLVITKALTRSKTLSRESFLLPVCPETCPFIQSFLTGSGRSFLLHGHVQLRTGLQTQDRHLFLFTDTLVMAKAKSANHFKQKAQVCVCEMWTAGCMDEVCEGSTNPERSFVLGWPTCNYVATFSSAEQKERWLTVLKSRIKEEKETEEPKTIPLRVYGKGINTFAVTKTLPVSNWDSTNEVVRLALQQFSIIGNVKDFQLWVISKRDNVPYPLIGHEFPFSIQMSHVRYSVSQGAAGDGRDAAASPAERQVVMQVEQLQAYKQCQFILKPRPTETPHVSAELPQKPLKRRRSFMAWAFWRGSSPHLNELSLGAGRGCLFRQPLSALCVDDALPKPVMDMLTFLYREGSWTRGIFRRPAGARAVRELRDSLDSGEFQLPLTRDHIFVIAGVFKDFLRSIPGSLLCCELHEEWVDVLEEEEEEEEQVQDVKRMIGRLPRENALLLRYLLAVLHGIQGNARENQMTSFNLSVCIAPSMLWPPGAPCSPEAEGEGTKKVCELVKFMIEHCEQILGQEPSSLFGGPPERPDTDDTASDPWLYPLTDSSYDSLENELDNSGSGGSPRFSSRTHLRPKTLGGSLDSILTFSDYDQDTDPETHHTRAKSPTGRKLRTLERTGGRQQTPHPSHPTQDTETVDTTSKLDSLSLDGQYIQRRCSEPAIAYATKFGPCISGSGDDLTGEEEELPERPSRQKHTTGETREEKDESALTLRVRTAALELSSPSLSSAPTSPEATCSSLDSPDSPRSHSSGGTWARRRGLHLSKPSAPPSVAPTAMTVSTAQTAGGHPTPGAGPKGSPPKEPLNWGTLRGCQGLHPNSWLKKGRRLSLTQQEHLEKEEEDKCGGPGHKPLTLGKPVQDKGKTNQLKPKPSRRSSRDAGEGLWMKPSKDKSQNLKRGSSSPPSHHRSTGSLNFPKSSWFQSSDTSLTVRRLDDSHANNRGGAASNHGGAAGREAREPKQPPPSLFYKQSRSSLSLFKQSKSQSVEEQSAARLYQRRGSEPGRQVMDRASTLTRARLPSDPGLKVTEADPEVGAEDARFHLSPCATKAVRDYFSSHPYSNPQSSQQVALALMESRREWLKRCSDPTAEADLEQLLFSEESYV